MCPDQVVVWAHRYDYEVPLLEVNPTLERHMARFFPGGDAFHRLSRHLLRPNAALTAALARYEHLAADCAVGLHMRTKKPGTSARVEHFATLARALSSGSRAGSVFLAVDAKVHSDVAALLPGRHVWWTNDTAAELSAGTITAAGNPGTEFSALLDVFLLARCRAIVLTPASSMGMLASGLAGVHPVYATHGSHTDPFINTCACVPAASHSAPLVTTPPAGSCAYHINLRFDQHWLSSAFGGPPHHDSMFTTKGNAC